MRHVTMVLLPVLLVCTAAFAAGPQAMTPANPEIAKLAPLLGSWTAEGVVERNPFEPDGKVSTKVSYEWFPGNASIVRHADGIFADAEYHALGVLTWARETSFSWYEINNYGIAGNAKMEIRGDELLLTWEQKGGQRTYKMRGVFSGLGGDRVTYRQEYMTGDREWKTYSKATMVRVRK